MPIYTRVGAFAYVSTPAPTTCTNAGQYYLLQGTFTNERLEGFEIGVNGLTYLGAACLFEIKVNATFSSNTNNNEVTLALFKNGVLENNSQMTAEINSTTDKIPIPLVDVIEMVTNNYIDIRIKSDKAGSIVTAETVTTSASKWD